MINVSVKKMAEDLNLEIIHMPEEDKFISVSEINRPGLQLSGFYKYFAFERVQLIGKVEWTYFNDMKDEKKKKRANEFFKYNIPCAIVTRNLEIPKELLEAAEKHNKPLFRTDMGTTKFVSKVINYLEDQLAPVITRHGVLVDVYGIGILMVGESGIGKSETALELIKRGHRLVADDAVEIKKRDMHVEGSAPELIRHFMEIRGIGILDIKHLYGVGSVRDKKNIELVVELKNWKHGQQYDRLGLDEEYTNILDVEVSKISLPIKPGRNLAMIIEVAARNYKQKKMGFNAAEALSNRILGHTMQ
ncbi:HPr(Ser) kinase/phosphatase [Anaeromicrobium sediminis]|uniref:HPr kinase/phosphorylase n=1 Tax=Anaeromicrobium sediminis TaxID=1478221 RepID=A0A267MFF2_9FIRM|nr:HPr(Ser) kinase/phosphatase [Anaeromicrobium sediminis]PAB58122.1 HPr kinase/phosphorylase [Anaeromicrobium sediminis]